MRFVNLLPPLLGTALLTIGIGSYSTLTTLQLQDLHYSVWAIGWVASLYFAGMIAGSYYAQAVIIRMKHVRAYVFFALIMALAALLQGFIPNAWVWAVMRFASAFCLGGLYIVIESWLLAACEERYKGQIMAVYLLIFYAFQSFSQLWLTINYSHEWMPFAVIAVWVSISIIPVIFAKAAVPLSKHAKMASPWVFIKLVPFGTSASLVSGLMFAMVYTLYPLFLVKAGFNTAHIASLMSITILGGALLQLPIGKISDLMDRRLVLIFVSLGLAIVALLMAFTYKHYDILALLSFILGGLVFVIYPLSISHASDCVNKTLALSAVSILTLAYSLGSMIGPLIMSGLLTSFGDPGFFVYIVLSSGLLALYGVFNVIKYKHKVEGRFQANFPEAVMGEQNVQTRSN
ncbi:MAG: MFS transporter [Gammaproteobacteria bacterium]|nr:MFS transporter [Gammaproteobacteria bacterium]